MSLNSFLRHRLKKFKWWKWCCFFIRWQICSVKLSSVKLNTNRFELNIDRTRIRLKKSSRLNCKLSRDRLVETYFDFEIVPWRVCVCALQRHRATSSRQRVRPVLSWLGLYCMGRWRRADQMEPLASTLFSFHRLSFVTKNTWEIR